MWLRGVSECVKDEVLGRRLKKRAWLPQLERTLGSGQGQPPSSPDGRQGWDLPRAAG